MIKNEISLEIVDKEDREVLRGKEPNYVRGWNQVKRRQAKDRKRWARLNGEELIG